MKSEKAEIQHEAKRAEQWPTIPLPENAAGNVAEERSQCEEWNACHGPTNS
jgi:hypothetical protein